MDRIFERFFGSSQLDRNVSAGEWQGGTAIPGMLGGTGQHGSFDPTLGQEIAPDTWLWDTDSMTIPAGDTLFGFPVVVADGHFEFSDFVIPTGTTVIFRGSHPAVIRVRGTVRIDGELRLDGDSPDPNFDPRSIISAGGIYAGQDGQPGTAAGAGGGRGGDGADGADGVGVQPRFFGAAGENLVAPALSAYASMTMGTGGTGGPLWPAGGRRASVTFTLFAAVCGQLAGGGGGGAFLGAGGTGIPLQSFAPADLGPSVAGGTAVPYLLPARSVSSLDHFLVGGAGGGGGGS